MEFSEEFIKIVSFFKETTEKIYLSIKSTAYGHMLATLKVLGHETEFKYLIKMNSSRSNQKPLMIFELIRWTSDELLCLPFLSTVN